MVSWLCKYLKITIGKLYRSYIQPKHYLDLYCCRFTYVGYKYFHHLENHNHNLHFIAQYNSYDFCDNLYKNTANKSYNLHLADKFYKHNLNKS